MSDCEEAFCAECDTASGQGWGGRLENEVVCAGCGWYFGPYTGEWKPTPALAAWTESIGDDDD